MRMGLDMSLARGSSSSSSVPFTPASLFTPLVAGGWYDPSDMSTLFQDDAGLVPVMAHGDPVGRINDKSGNANHLIQTGVLSRPLYQSDASGKYLLFDGTDDFLAATRTITLPFDRLTALRQVTWTVNEYIYYASSNSGSLYQNATTPDLRLISGTTTNPLRTSALTVGSNGVVTERHIANASKIAVGNGAYAGPIDAGATAPATIHLGAVFNGTVAANIRFYGAVERAGSMTDAEIASLRTYLGAKCGTVL